MEFTGKEDVVDLFNKTYYRNPFWKLKTPTIPSNLRPKKYYIKKKIVNFSVLSYSIGRRSKTHYRRFKKKHPHAGHFCYAYQIGTDTTSYRANDDGEPSNSAGMPIYGQILSFSSQHTLVVVARILALGVGGLISA
jgi:hypothetical protein